MKYVDFDDEFTLIRKPMTHPNFIIRNYLMGELAGGEGGGEREVERSWLLVHSPACLLFQHHLGFCGAGLSPAHATAQGLL